MIAINGQIIIFIEEWTHNTPENVSRVKHFVSTVRGENP